GKGGVYLLVFISQPILARLFKPEQFGEFALYNSILAILLIISSGRYEASIVLSRRASHANGIFQLAQSWLLGVVFILSIALLLIPFFRLTLFIPLPASTLLLLPIAVLFAGYWQVVQNWLIRFGKHEQFSFALFTQRLIILFFSFIAAYFLPDQNGLILGLFAGLTYTFIFSVCTKKASLRANTRKLATYAAYYKDFPLYSIPTLLLFLATLHLPVLWLSTFFDEHVTGSYNMAYMVISLPFTFLTTGLAPLFYEQMSRRNKTEQIALLKKVCEYTFLLLTPLVLAGLIFGGDIMLWVLGENWYKAGEFVILLSPLILTICLESWLSISLTVFHKQRLGMQLQLAKLLSWLLIFAVGTYLENIQLIFTLVSCMSICYVGVVSFAVIRYFNKRHDSYSNCALAK
ncbi:MAG: lipopolysaccharide biosynthesis protein, partial [Bacteroidetes bacterium]|nr:lipopolysaccharide biosynthesis protein [Bacteroidota bacterium]